MESLGNILVDGVVDQSKIARQHRRSVQLVLDVRIGVVGDGLESLPLLSTTGALDQCPLVLEQRCEELCD